MDESIEKHAIVYFPPGADQSMLSALHADGWKDVGRSDQLESAFSFLLVCREDLLKHPPSQPTNLALVIPSPPDPPHGLLDLLNGPLQTCGLLQWNGATLVQRRPGELLSPPTQPPPINPDVAGRIQGGVVDLPPGPRAEEIDALLGRHEPDKERANVPPPKPRRPKPVALALTRDARRRAEAEGIAMARGTECLDAANAFDALWTIAAARTQGRRIALIMLGEELGEEGHRLSAAADMLEPGIDIHWLGKAPPKSSQSSPGVPPPPPEVEIEIPTTTPQTEVEPVPSADVLGEEGAVLEAESAEDSPDGETTTEPAASASVSATPRPSEKVPPPPPPPPPSDTGSGGNEPPRDPTDLDLLRAAGEGPDVLLPVALQAIAAATGGIPPIFNRDSGEIRVGLPGGPELGWLSALPTTPSTPAEAWGEWLAHWLDHAQRFAEARRDAITDPLTLTLNRRGFEHHLREVIQEGSRQRHPFSILKLDVDDFKQWNDRYGDEAGDSVLRAFAEAIRNAIRPADQIARVGGDEFVVILADFTRRTGPESHVPRGFSAEATQDLLDRIRDGVARVQLEVPGRIRFSGGLATWPWDILDQSNQDPIEGLVQLADRRLKISKRDGKNRIEFGDQPPA
ncbi:MAG: GGDEF domain-containing protein [Phycisphaerales bacterium]